MTQSTEPARDKGAEIPQSRKIDVRNDAIANDPALPGTGTAATFGGLLPGTSPASSCSSPAGQYSTDPDTQVVDGRWATVKQIAVTACQTTPLEVGTFSQKQRQGHRRDEERARRICHGEAFGSRPARGEARGSLQYKNDHAAGGPEAAHERDRRHPRQPRPHRGLHLGHRGLRGARR